MKRPSRKIIYRYLSHSLWICNGLHALTTWARACAHPWCIEHSFSCCVYIYFVVCFYFIPFYSNRTRTCRSFIRSHPLTHSIATICTLSICRGRARLTVLLIAKVMLLLAVTCGVGATERKKSMTSNTQKNKHAQQRCMYCWRIAHTNRQIIRDYIRFHTQSYVQIQTLSHIMPHIVKECLFTFPNADLLDTGWKAKKKTTNGIKCNTQRKREISVNSNRIDMKKETSKVEWWNKKRTLDATTTTTSTSTRVRNKQEIKECQIFGCFFCFVFSCFAFCIVYYCYPYVDTDIIHIQKARQV